LLSDIISADESVALQDVLMKRQHIDTLIDWLSNRRTVSWGVHVEKVAAEKAALAEVQERERRSSHSAWLAEIRAMSRPPCHTCKSTDEVVPIFYGLMDNMDLPTFGLFVRGGCVIDLEDPRWLCKRCDESFRD
jgi:hypothetical protein